MTFMGKLFVGRTKVTQSRSIVRRAGLAAAVALSALLFAGTHCAAQTDSVVTLRTPPLIADPTGT